MQLIALLVVLVLGGLVMGRMGGGSLLAPGQPPQPSPAQTTAGVEKATEASSQAEQRHVEEAMKGLR